jgi:hypothetical protein
MPSQNLFQSIKQKQKDITINNLKNSTRNSVRVGPEDPTAVKVVNTTLEILSQGLRGDFSGAVDTGLRAGRAVVRGVQNLNPF